MAESSAAASEQFVSGLGKGREAFHAEVTEYCLRIGERTAEDFLRHFSCGAIMRSLEARPMERARIVSRSTGVHEKVALKLSPDASGETLQIALDERVTTPADIVRLFQPDDRQRYLPRHALWAFNIEGEPWKASVSNKAVYDRAKSYLAYILERALGNLLISHEEIVTAISVAKLAKCLPKEKLGAIIEASLRKSDKFTEEDLLGAVPPSSLVEHVALDYIWERVVVPLIAEAHDYVAKKQPPEVAKPAALEAPPVIDAESSWGDPSLRSMRPADDKQSAPVHIAPDSSVSEHDIVGEDEIIETSEEVSTTPTSAAKDVVAARGR